MDIQEYISSGIIETYVMGLCSPDEEMELEKLRSQYPELDEAIVRHETELEKNMQQNSILPPASVDEKVLSSIQSLGVYPLQAVKESRSAKTNRYNLAIAAAVLLLVGSALFNFIQFNQNKKLKKELAFGIETKGLPPEDFAIMTNPTITPVAMYGVGIHSICRCTMFWDKKTGKAYVMIHHLVNSSESRDYQLWAIVDEKPVSVGLIDDSIRGRFIEVSNVPAGAKAFSVTLEKAGGSETPDMGQLYLHGSI